MDSFSIISQYVLNVSKEQYIPTSEITHNVKYEFWKFVFGKELPNTQDIIGRTVKMLFYMFITKHDKYETKNKFVFLKESMENIFCNVETREEVFNIFNKIQSVYHKLSRLAFLYKYKKSAVKIDSDVFLTPILENQRNTMTILQNGYKYIFTLTDIINIINSCLGNTEYFFASPHVIKNPYNNIPFSKATLYNIYYKIKASNYIMPILFQAFFLENFNLCQYALNNESIIREYSIKKHIDSGREKVLCKEIILMLKSNHYGKRIHIDTDFPKKVLLNVMKPYLQLHYLGNYSVDYSKRILKQKELDLRLSNFVKHNQFFGRKTIKLHKCIFTGKKCSTITFNESYIPFYKTDKRFYVDHVIVNYNEEDDDEDSDEDDT